MNICVFCGSSIGNDPVFGEAARELGYLIAKNSHNLVYGGGNVGLMGIVADSVLNNGGEVTGIIPKFLMDREVGHSGITRLEVVQSMHQRKQRMADLSNAFVAMPGGWGTLEELAEILTWRQLGLINNPIILLNINNFFGPLITQLNGMHEAGFVRKEYLDNLMIASTPQAVLSLIIPRDGLKDSL
jgi:uncharacterized protein (TIGR00730 family)